MHTFPPFGSKKSTAQAGVGEMYAQLLCFIVFWVALGHSRAAAERQTYCKMKTQRLKYKFLIALSYFQAQINCCKTLFF